MIDQMSTHKICLSPPATGWSPQGLPQGRAPSLGELLYELQRVSGLSHGVRARREAHQQACQAVSAAVRGPDLKFQQSPFLSAAVLPAFVQCFGKASQLKLQRFGNLKGKLASVVVPALYTEAADACWPAIEQACEHARGEQAVKGSLSHNPYSVLAGKVADLLAQELMVRLECVDKLKAKAGPAAACLQEHAASAAER